MGDGPADRSESGIDIGVARAAAEMHAAGRRLVAHRIHGRDVQQQTGGGRETGIRVAAGADGEGHFVGRSPEQAGAQIIGRGAACDRLRHGRGEAEIPRCRDRREVGNAALEQMTIERAGEIGPIGRACVGARIEGVSERRDGKAEQGARARLQKGAAVEGEGHRAHLAGSALAGTIMRQFA